jgi:uncharacterized protein YdhG (YjbR/CyaY superfamily)
MIRNLLPFICFNRGLQGPFHRNSNHFTQYMQGKKPDTVTEYISSFPKETQEILKKIRATIKKTVPGMEETISYGIPTFNLHGQYLIYYAGFKKHISIYPAPRGDERFKTILAKYKGGRGTVQFPLDEPIPYSLLVRITKHLAKNQQRKQAVKAAR